MVTPLPKRTASPWLPGMDVMVTLAQWSNMCTSCIMAMRVSLICSVSGVCVRQALLPPCDTYPSIMSPRNAMWTRSGLPACCQ